MVYNSLDELSGSYLKALIEDISEVQMKITLFAEEHELEDPFEMVAPISHARQVLQLCKKLKPEDDETN
jgi:hypothetical protein